jgi:uncharacterized protein (TIGR00299 family) protein
MVLYYDCFSGISGDMNLAALIDLGVPSSYLLKELKKLKVDGYNIDVSRDQRNGIKGTKVKVVLDKDQHSPRRHLSDIAEIINNSELNDNVREISHRMFRKLAEAEAHVHGKEINEIHFHEVGAIDSIVDIIGAAICLDYLKPDKILGSAIELGSGMIKCEHGILPVPAPATAEILKDIPVKSGNQDFEATTPTGAVILACNVDEFCDLDNFQIDKTAYGIGHKESEKPNVLRVFKGKVKKPSDKHLMFECNIDDMNPEILSYIMEKLFTAGADDVFITPIIMKKSRNASKICILCSEDARDEVTNILIHETSSFGFRSYYVDKTELERDNYTLETKHGKVGIKRAYYQGKVVKQKAEYEDCARIAREQNIPIKDIYREIERLLNQ